MSRSNRLLTTFCRCVIEEGDRSVFLLALRNVAEAHGGMGVPAEKFHLSRENLYRMLSQQGNPEIKSLYALLQAMGLRLAIEPKDRSTAVFDHQPSGASDEDLLPLCVLCGAHPASP